MNISKIVTDSYIDLTGVLRQQERARDNETAVPVKTGRSQLRLMKLRQENHQLRL